MNTPDDNSSPFHPGELAVQDRAGVLEDADFLGRRMFRPYLTEAHRQFFPMLRYVFVGSMDEEGQLWASMLIGAPGFVHAPGPDALAIDAAVQPGDPLARGLRSGAPLGLLGIQLETRRRNRVNGHVRELSHRGFVLQVDQSFGNCPKYISARAPSLTPPPIAAAAPPDTETALLSERALATIATADTSFIASASAREVEGGDTREGIDVSHRGGNPGFIRVERGATRTRLVIADFPGNNAFNTLGNLTRYPRAGLLVPSFDSGDVLLLTCDAEVTWRGEHDRAIALEVRSGFYFSRFMPFSWGKPVPSPQLVGSRAR